MTTDRALQLVDEVCARLQRTRQDYVNLQEAIGVLRTAHNTAGESDAERTASQEPPHQAGQNSTK